MRYPRLAVQGEGQFEAGVHPQQPPFDRVGGLPELPGGSTVKLQRLGMDYLDLSVDCRIATL